MRRALDAILLRRAEEQSRAASLHEETLSEPTPREREQHITRNLILEQLRGRRFGLTAGELVELLTEAGYPVTRDAIERALHRAVNSRLVARQQAGRFTLNQDTRSSS